MSEGGFERPDGFIKQPNEFFLPPDDAFLLPAGGFPLLDGFLILFFFCFLNLFSNGREIFFFFFEFFNGFSVFFRLPDFRPLDRDKI